MAGKVVGVVVAVLIAFQWGYRAVPHAGWQPLCGDALDNVRYFRDAGEQFVRRDEFSDAVTAWRKQTKLMGRNARCIPDQQMAELDGLTELTAGMTDAEVEDLFRLSESLPETSNDVSPEEQRSLLAVVMRESILDAIEGGGYPLDLTQAEFQDDGEGGVVFVTQFNDPIESAVDAGGLPTASETVFRNPLQALRDAAGSHASELQAIGDLSEFVIAFRDPEQTVYQITPETMWRYVDGELTWHQVADEMSITSLTQ